MSTGKLHSWDNDPLVSVVIPVYNAERFIERTLQSVLNQTYRNTEVLVVNDGSCDRTPEIVQTIAQQDPRVRLLSQANSGVAAARNLAIQSAQGEFIAPIDADDIWYPTNLEKQVRCLTKCGLSTGFVYSWSVEIDEKDELSGGFHVATYRDNVYLRLLHHNFLGHASATLIRRDCFETLGGYDCGLRQQGAQGCEDWDLYLRIAERYAVNVVPEFLVGYRQSTDSMSCSSDLMAQSHELVLNIALKNHPEIPAILYQWSMSNVCVHLAYQNLKTGQHHISQRWLYRALQLDFKMVVLRPDLYLILSYYFLEIFSRIIKYLSFFSKTNGQSKQRQNLAILDIKAKVRIRKFFPSRLYEKIRINSLSLSKAEIKKPTEKIPIMLSAETKNLS